MPMSSDKLSVFRGYTCKHREDCESRDKYGWSSCEDCDTYEKDKKAVTKWPSEDIPDEHKE